MWNERNLFKKIMSVRVIEINCTNDRKRLQDARMWQQERVVEGYIVRSAINDGGHENAEIVRLSWGYYGHQGY